MIFSVLWENNYKFSMQKNTSRSSKNSDLSEAIKEISNHLSLGLNKNNAKVKVEQVVEAILYRLKTSCQWRHLPIYQFFEVDYRRNSVIPAFCKVEQGKYLG